MYLVVIVGAAVALLALLVILFLNIGEDPDGDDIAPTSQAAVTSEPAAPDPGQPATTANGSTSASNQTTASTATTASPSTATSSSGATSSSSIGSTTPPPATQPVVWPAPGSGTQFATPDDAARSFAEDLAGFNDPVLSPFRAGDGRSGEIDLQPIATGPVSTILLRQVGTDDSWSVIAVVNDNIIIDQPAPGEAVANPMTLSGQARAFEGHVDVRIYVHGQTSPIAEGFVTGRGDGVLGRFDSTLDWPSSTRGSGMLVLGTFSANDGAAWDVAAVPVSFS